MALSEIEKLERRYAENPQGLTFAPLAEVHRKNGKVQRALDLLGPGLALHPDYIPASIVLGRCHLDLGDVHAAERAFLHVLALDGENVIALKALADISERLLKFEDAERWLQTLLSLDRSNDDAREQLQRVEVARRQAEVASSAKPEARLEPELPAGPATASAVEATESATEAAPASVSSFEPPAAEPEPGIEAPIAEPASAYEPPVAEPTVGWVSQSSEQSELPSPATEELEPSGLREQFEDVAALEVTEPTRYDEEVQPLDGLVGRELDVPDEFRVETSEDIVLRSSGGGEFQVPDASQELFAGGSKGERAPFEEDAPVSPPAPVAESGSAVAEPAAPPASEPVRSPEIVGWGERVAEPAQESQPEPTASAAVPEPEPQAIPIDHYPAPAAPPSAAPQPAAAKGGFAASETGGRPVAQFLRDILSARPPAQAAAPAVRQAPAASGSGAPTRPAADSLSLSSVFGEEEAPATPPAVPAAGAGSGVSFDDFFGAPGAAPTQRGTRSPDPKNDDLDQFHAWLQNLKR
jgi:hypothetical protein